ncbi:MAG: sodium/proton antiporter NhaB [Gammaproteobacteria bacterium]|jgi:NhaB family Na+:H+ antiporter|nr:sodium/proton antiporter NhaB [Chromatiales bacterium]MDP7093444.1 sodium/proton antiporter NhaB [Gammaproteobacteria bacterium]MDP7269998.1 sodium/proton antiporter NhaB [Gammaproteobacteria bacterium]MDP7660998.1 sodium/proton antiporter NhaB [Gammaproteobacteria bacterium]HJP03774.1 sodium/proton antiporter NhaB [Gammaproteobacteria bacterium]
MNQSLRAAFLQNFLGHSPDWYKAAIVGFLALNPVLLFTVGPVVAGWALVLEFIFTLAMALKCYPLQPGGLLAIQAVLLGMTTPEAIYHEAEHNFPVIMLLMFMVAGIYFLKDMLLFVFTKVLLGIRSKLILSLLFCSIAAVLSAFLDALTVTAVVIAVAEGFYAIYHKVASGKGYDHSHDSLDDDQVEELHKGDLLAFRAFLRNLMMHAAVGTALGGVTTMVGEPQNLLIAEEAGWEFVEFAARMAPVTAPVFVVGLLTCLLVELTGLFGYGAKLPQPVRKILQEYNQHENDRRTNRQWAAIIVQAFTALYLVIALALHLAEVGIIGLGVIVLATAFCGVTMESQVGHAFEEALPFTTLLVVFFGIVAVIDQQNLFTPIVEWVFTLEGRMQTAMFYVANGALSMISDNVFVATIYISEIKEALDSGRISRETFDALAVAINTGTNIPSVATPNGQAAFLFLLTSALAPLIRLSYGRMVLMALPYTITMSLAGFAAVYYWL